MFDSRAWRTSAVDVHQRWHCESLQNGVVDSDPGPSPVTKSARVTSRERWLLARMTNRNRAKVGGQISEDRSCESAVSAQNDEFKSIFVACLAKHSSALQGEGRLSCKKLIVNVFAFVVHKENGSHTPDKICCELIPPSYFAMATNI